MTKQQHFLAKYEELIRLQTIALHSINGACALEGWGEARIEQEKTYLASLYKAEHQAQWFCAISTINNEGSK